MSTTIPPSEHPLPNVRSSLVPRTLVHVKTFAAPDLEALDAAIEEWVKQTGNLIVQPGMPNVSGKEIVPDPLSMKQPDCVFLSVTYVKAVEGHHDQRIESQPEETVQVQQVEDGVGESPPEPSRSQQASVATLSDGRRSLASGGLRVPKRS